MRKIAKNFDLTTGNLKRNLIFFAMPSLLSNLFNCLYSAIDLIFIGQFSLSYDIAAVSAGTTIMFAINSIILGLVSGGTIIIGNKIGAKSEDVGKATKCFMSYMSILTVAITVIMFCLFYPIMKWMNLDQNTIGIARKYLLILVIGIPFYSVYHTYSAVLKGNGNSNAGFIFLAVAVISNIVLDALFVIVLHMGAVGAAIATTLGHFIGMISALLYMRKFRLPYILPKGMNLNKADVISFVRTGVPIAIQDGLVILSFAVILSFISIRGVEYTSAVGITDRVTSFGFAPMSAIGCAISTAAAQNIGAKKLDNVKKYLKYGFVLSLIIGFALSAIFVFASYPLAWVFSGDNTEAREIANLYIKATALDLIVCGFVFPLNSLFLGAKHSVFSMSQNLLTTFAIRLPLAIIFVSVLNLPMFIVGLAYPIATTFSLSVCIWFYFSKRWLKNTGICELQK